MVFENYKKKLNYFILGGKKSDEMDLFVVGDIEYPVAEEIIEYVNVPNNALGSLRIRTNEFPDMMVNVKLRGMHMTEYVQDSTAGGSPILWYDNMLIDKINKVERWLRGYDNNGGDVDGDFWNPGVRTLTFYKTASGTYLSSSSDRCMFVKGTEITSRRILNDCYELDVTFRCAPFFYKRKIIDNVDKDKWYFLGGKAMSGAYRMGLRLNLPASSPVDITLSAKTSDADDPKQVDFTIYGAYGRRYVEIDTDTQTVTAPDMEYIRTSGVMPRLSYDGYNNFKVTYSKPIPNSISAVITEAYLTESDPQGRWTHEFDETSSDDISGGEEDVNRDIQQ